MQTIDPTRYAKLPRPDDFGPACQLQWLPVASLVIDDSYQRPIAEKGARTIRAIMAGFDWRKFAPVVVSPLPGGSYAIVDGQHRTTAAAACGHDQVPCAIIMADRRMQAEAFGSINGLVTEVTGVQRFKAALAAGDPVAVRTNEVARAGGVRILHSNTPVARMRPGDTLALTSIQVAVARHGEPLAILALKAVMASVRAKGGHVRGPIIAAVVAVLADRPAGRDEARLLQAFGGIDLEQAWRNAAATAALKRGVAPGDALRAAIAAHLEGQGWRVAA